MASASAWNVGNEASRKILVKLGHSAVIRFRLYGNAYNDLLNMEILGIVGDVAPNYGITLDEAIARQRNDGVNGDLM